MSLFDVYIVVDWSASSSPNRGKDSIWVGTAARRGSTLDLSTVNPSTRTEATTLLEAILQNHAASNRSVLLGFDFPYGYPTGFAAATNRDLDDVPPWLSTWNRLQREVDDDTSNRNNRFEVASLLNRASGMSRGPFWGCPANRQADRLLTTCHNWQHSTLRQFRHTDRRLRDRKLHVQEVWKLWGVGSVGSQALLGIPRVASLRFSAALTSISRVWPFETGFGADPIGACRPFVLHCEIWPGIVALRETDDRVRDDVQVETLAHHLAHLDGLNQLGPLFDRPVDLPDEAVRDCLLEEGWILGA